MTPDKWVVIKITAPDYILYKVFASFYGGYLGSDSWKLNSGIKSVDIYDGYIDFIGYSGSIYRCAVGHNCYGTSVYSQGVLKNMMEYAEKHNVEIEILPEDTNWSKLLND